MSGEEQPSAARAAEDDVDAGRGAEEGAKRGRRGEVSCCAGSWAEGLGEEGDLRRIVVQFSPGAMLDRLDNACGLSTQREERIAKGKRGGDVESEGGWGE